MPSTGTIWTTRALVMVVAAFWELAHAYFLRCHEEDGVVEVAHALLLVEIGKNADTDDHPVAPDRQRPLRYSFSQEDAVADTDVVLDELHGLGAPVRP